LKLVVSGDANDYVGKGLSGGIIVVRPAQVSPLKASENTIIGNTVLYGATDGLPLRLGPGRRTLCRAQLGREGRGRGLRLERVRIHDRRCRRDPRVHRRNFGAGMTGGMAYLYDPEGVAAGEYEHGDAGDGPGDGRPLGG
jgi:glutamate synthase (NADPH/NADH) large chain